MNSHNFYEDGETFMSPLPTPIDIHNRCLATSSAIRNVKEARGTIRSILERKDPRMLMICGPCSIHDDAAAREYADLLATAAKKYSDTMFFVMRTYFEKPRTIAGWKGWINDPFLDQSHRLDEGVFRARDLLLHLAKFNMPTATELLDPLSYPYFGDLVSWTSVGARTVESQIHREFASSIDGPVAFKNSTEGAIDVAINAILTARQPHSFMGIDSHGKNSVIRSTGNKLAHLVLRGGRIRPNYERFDVGLAEEALAREDLPVNIVIDCSHGNSRKNHFAQQDVIKNVASQLEQGNTSIIGVMLESFIEPGNQAIPKDLSKLKYGSSITDACLDWSTTERLLEQLAIRVGPALMNRFKKAQ